MSEIKLRPDFVTGASQLETERVNQLKTILPEAFADGKINFETLRQLLGDYVEPEDDEEIEHFGLSWPGKRDARRLASLPSEGTLVPVPGEGVNEDTTHNLFIEGDNLEVLKLLQKAYAGRVKLIYIDPPYNTGNDFVYIDDFSEPLETYLRRSGQKGESGELLTTNPKTSGRFHSRWLTMLYPRLLIAKSLLSQDGLIFVSIDDNEVYNLRSIMNEIFGEENFVSQVIVIANKRGQTYKEISKTHEYLLIYSNEDEFTLNELDKSDGSLPYQDAKGAFDLWELRNRNPKFGRFNRPNLFFPIYVAPTILDQNGYSKVSLIATDDFNIEVLPKNSEGQESCWRWSADKISSSDLLSDMPEVVARQKKDGDWNIYEKSRKATTKAKSLWDETEVISEQGTIQLGELGLGAIFDHPKPVGLISKIIKIGSQEGDIVLDFFAGAGTTGQAVFSRNIQDGGNRQFILIQLPEPTKPDSAARKAGYKFISDITKERLRRVCKKFTDEQNGKLVLDGGDEKDFGFCVYKLTTSNFKKWNNYLGASTQVLQTSFDDFETPLVDTWTWEKLLSEILLIEGFPLDSRVTKQEQFTKNEVLLVESDFHEYRLWVCLDEKLEAETVSTLEIAEEDTFICLDNALVDGDKLYLADNINLRTI